MIDQDLIQKAITLVENHSQEKNTDYFCVTRDVFEARNITYGSKKQKYIESAIIGELGNNSFDHNWKFEDGKMRGAYFNQNFENKYVLLADFGRGLTESLNKVINIENDLDALKTAFTKLISGRTPEQRGNGLKFVKNTCIENNWDLYFHSGNANCFIHNKQISFNQTDIFVQGSLAIIDFFEDKNEN